MIKKEAVTNWKKFFAERKGDYSFNKVIEKAFAEYEEQLGDKGVLLDKGKINQSSEVWRGKKDTDKLLDVLQLGLTGISLFSPVIAVDFAKIIPNCLAISLLFVAYKGIAEIQIIDAGDEPDKAAFISALQMLSGSCDRWNCKVVNPVMVEISNPEKKIRYSAQQESSGNLSSRDTHEDNSSKAEGPSGFFQRLFKGFTGKK